MGIYRKENGVPVPKAGFAGFIDNVLNKFSNNAISNKAVTEEFDRINADILELAIKVQSAGLPALNYTTPLHNFGSVRTYTATKECYVTGMIYGNTNLVINNTVLYYGASDGSYYQPMSLPVLRCEEGDVISTSGGNPYLNVFEKKA